MAYAIKHLKGGTWIDISIYVVGLDKIPQRFRNKDFSVSIKSVGIVIAKSIRQHASYGDDFEFSADEQIDIYDGATPIFGGFISKTTFGADDMTFKLNVTVYLAALQTVLVGYDQMHAAFASGASGEYWVDYIGFRSVSVLWALEKAFTASGLTLDVPSALKTKVLLTKTQKESVPVWNSKVVHYADLYFDEYQLYYLRASIAISPFTVEYKDVAVSEGNRRDRNYGERGLTKKVTITKRRNDEPEVNCFELASEIFSVLGLSVKSLGGKAFRVVDTSTQLIVSAENIYSFSKESRSSELLYIGYSYVGPTKSIMPCPVAESQRQWFYEPTVVTQLKEVSDGGDDKIGLLSNFTIYFADTDDFSGPYNEYESQIELHEDMILDDNTEAAAFNILATKYRDKVLNPSIETILIDSDFSDNVAIQNDIDAEWDNSEIVQEAVNG